MPTFAFTIDGIVPRIVAERLGEDGIQAWDGHYYAVAVTERLGLQDHGGTVRVGPAHYNTIDEVTRFFEVFKQIVI